jgi:RHS repeat-associated protein
MDALADTQEGTEFEVSWGDSDSGSGVKDYTVQVKVDDGAWQTWQSNTPATSATYNGDHGHTYSFQVRSRDRANNLSAWSSPVSTATPSTIVTKYYYLGGQRVAMREGNTPVYLHTDHLGSASLATNTSGGKVSEMRYYAYGGTRSGTMDTDRLYTGQRWEASIGLYDYNARYYDPVLGRFVQADTVVPSPQNAQAFNRYSYVLNSPLRYTDPSGHCMIDDPECLRKLQSIERDCAIYIENHSDWTVETLSWFEEALIILENAFGKSSFYQLIRTTSFYVDNLSSRGYFDSETGNITIASKSFASKDDLISSILHEIAHRAIELIAPSAHETRENKVEKFASLTGWYREKEGIWVSPQTGPTEYARGNLDGQAVIPDEDMAESLAIFLYPSVPENIGLDTDRR